MGAGKGNGLVYSLPLHTRNPAIPSSRFAPIGTLLGSTPGEVSFADMIKRSAPLMAEALQFQRENSPRLSTLGKPQIG
jgi:hypothetical protein